MDDLINRQDVIDKIKEFKNAAQKWKDETGEDGQEEHSNIWHRADSAIASALEIGLRVKKIPTIGATEVVRCKDCKYMASHYDMYDNAPYWTCSQWDAGTGYDGFCHYAERKEDE